MEYMVKIKERELMRFSVRLYWGGDKVINKILGG